MEIEIHLPDDADFFCELMESLRLTYHDGAHKILCRMIKQAFLVFFYHTFCGGLFWKLVGGNLIQFKAAACFSLPIV